MTTPKQFARKPGSRWRVLSHGKDGVNLSNAGAFDELVVDHWLHVEQMDTRDWWIRIGDMVAHVRINTNGSVAVRTEADR